MQIPGMEMAAGKHLRFGSRALQILADCVVNTGDGVATATSPPEAGPSRVGGAGKTILQLACRKSRCTQACGT